MKIQTPDNVYDALTDTPARNYDKYQRFKATAPTALAVEELDSATLKALAASRMDQRHYK